MNKVMITGRLTKEPIVRNTCALFSLAVTRVINGEKTADYISFTAFGKTAENVIKYCHKGDKILVLGNVKTGSYQNKQGITVYTTEINVEQIEFLSKTSDAQPQVQPVQYEKPKQVEVSMMGEDDDLPF